MSATVLKEEIITDDDISVYLDGDMNRNDFNENIVEVKGEDYTHLYIDNGNLSNEVCYDILPRQKGKVINLLLEEELTDYTAKELSAMPTDTVYEHLTSCYSVYSGSEDIDTFLELCSTHNIKTERDNYLEIEVIGYSQGDRATVLVNKVEALKVWGSEDIDESDLKDTLTNYFYDTPSCVRIMILGTEYISERFDGRYQNFQDKDNYDKDEFIEELKEYFKDEIEDLEFFEEQLEDYLPSELQHHD